MQTFLFPTAALRQDLGNRTEPYDCKKGKKALAIQLLGTLPLFVNSV